VPPETLGFYTLSQLSFFMIKSVISFHWNVLLVKVNFGFLLALVDVLFAGLSHFQSYDIRFFPLSKDDFYIS
jgi:hypothetical protein